MATPGYDLVIAGAGFGAPRLLRTRRTTSRCWSRVSGSGGHATSPRRRHSPADSYGSASRGAISRLC
jgi:hypothetical protein